jgi:hypothetical protein
MKCSNRIVLAIFSFLAFVSHPALAQPKVAVLVEAGMIAASGTPSISPVRIASVLQSCGIPAQNISVNDILAGKLTFGEYPVLVLPYGNGFPLAAYDALRSYHASGGCFIMSDVPFTHPLVLVKGEWTDQGHHPRFQDDRNGIGTGGFQETKDGPLNIARSNPLGLNSNSMPLPIASGAIQCLSTKELAATDEVIPLVEHVNAGDRQRQIASALILHKDDPFNEAIDVWIGRVADVSDENGAYYSNQIIVRGAAYCLREKGFYTAEQTDSVMSAAARLPRPKAYPNNLAYKVTSRPWGNTYVPISKAPERTLLVVENMDALTADERAALWSLQGLSSRTRPCLWLSSSHDLSQDFLLQTMIDARAIDGYKIVDDWKLLFTQFASCYKGAVVYDPELYRGDSLAVNIAGAEDLIATSASVAEELHLPIAVDLRGRFDNYADGLDWVWKRDRKKLNHRLCHIARTIISSSAYTIQWKGVELWPTGAIDAEMPGADQWREKSIVAHIFSQMEPNTAMLGYPYGGAEGIGIGEGNGVKLMSQYGITLIASDFMDNLPILSGAPVAQLVQKPQPPAPPLEKDKIYIALAMSDGDNMGIWRWMHEAYFQRARYGDFPLAFGMGPDMIDLQPSVAQWYYNHAAPNTEFISDVSGVAYMQPENYGTSFKNPSEVLNGFLKWTGDYMNRMDMHSVRTVEGDDGVLSHYISQIHPLDSVFADMGRDNGHKGINNLTYLMSNVPVFRAATTWNYGKTGFLRDVREQVGDVRPAFVNGFVHLWTYDMDSLIKTYDARDPDMVFVTPSQLSKLYQEAKAKGWTK